MMKRLISIILALVMAAALFGCGTGKTAAAPENPAAPAEAAPAEAPAEPGEVRTKTDITVGCGTSSGVGYATASTVGAILQNLYPEYYTAKPEITTGGAESIRLMAAGDVILCSAMLDDVVAAYNGERGFEGTEGKIRYITSGNMTTIQAFVREGVEAESLADCGGLRIGIGSGTMFNYYWPYLCETYGMTEDQFKSVESMATKDAAEAIRNNQLDVFIAVTAVPNATMQDVGMSNGIGLLTMSEEEMDKIISLQPAFQKTSVDLSLYSGEGTVNTVGVRNVYICFEDTDYQLVYDWVKAIDENNDALKAAHPQAGEYGDHDNVLECQLIPFADAAADYYTQTGLLK